MKFLDQKYQELCSEFGRTEIVKRIRDSFGVYAFLIYRPKTKKQYYFAAKRNMRGTIVSVNKELWDESLKDNIPILLAIAEYFYLFLPENLRTVHHFENVRDEKYLMMNWCLKESCGQNLRDLKTLNENPVKKLLTEQLELVSQ